MRRATSKNKKDNSNEKGKEKEKETEDLIVVTPTSYSNKRKADKDLPVVVQPKLKVFRGDIACPTVQSADVLLSGDLKFLKPTGSESFMMISIYLQKPDLPHATPVRLPINNARKLKFGTNSFQDLSPSPLRRSPAKWSITIPLDDDEESSEIQAMTALVAKSSISHLTSLECANMWERLRPGMAPPTASELESVFQTPTKTWTSKDSAGEGTDLRLSFPIDRHGKIQYDLIGGNGTAIFVEAVVAGSCVTGTWEIGGIWIRRAKKGDKLANLKLGYCLGISGAVCQLRVEQDEEAQVEYVD